MVEVQAMVEEIVLLALRLFAPLSQLSTAPTRGHYTLLVDIWRCIASLTFSLSTQLLPYALLRENQVVAQVM